MMNIVNFNSLTKNQDYLAKAWSAPIYAFFHPVPAINYVGHPA